MNIKIFISILFLIFVANEKLHAQKPRYKTFKSITQLTSSAPDTCFLTCVVVGTYTCPPCPPGAECKPCIGDHVQVSDGLNDKKNFIRLLVADPQKYIKQKKCTFLIKLHKTVKKQVYEAVIIEGK